MKSILDKSFKYVPADRSDIRKTFDRVRYEQARVGRTPNVVHMGTLVVGRVEPVKPLRKVSG